MTSWNNVFLVLLGLLCLAATIAAALIVRHLIQNEKQDMTTLQYEDSGYREKQLQKEKDEFAIGFAEWYLRLWLRNDDSSFLNYSTKELLEIYKQEKGL